jgi:hypothetical protein
MSFAFLTRAFGRDDPAGEVEEPAFWPSASVTTASARPARRSRREARAGAVPGSSTSPAAISTCRSCARSSAADPAAEPGASPHVGEGPPVTVQHLLAQRLGHHRVRPPRPPVAPRGPGRGGPRLPARASRRDRRAGRADAVVTEALGQKVLHAFLQNRHQTSSCGAGP